MPPGCSNVDSGDSGSHTLVSGLNSFAITNTVTCTYLTLQKTVVGGSATPAQWTLSATGPTTVTGPGNSAAVTKVHVAPGAYQLAETGPTGYQQTSLTCAPRSVSGSTVTLVGGDDVTCTFTNTAAHPVVLTKAWINATPGDTVGLQITNGAATATGTSTAPSTTTPATLTALAGDTVALAETFTTGDPARYATTLACDNGVTVDERLLHGPTDALGGRHDHLHLHQRPPLRDADLAEGVGRTAPPVTPRTCPSTARRRAADSQPRPRLCPTAHGLSTATATATVFSGDTVDLAEAFGGKHRHLRHAASTCSDPTGLVYVAGALSGTYTVPVTPTDLVCTFTNTRTSATLILQKEWVTAPRATRPAW